VLDVLFALDRRISGVMGFKIDETIYPVSRREAFDQSIFVLENAPN
jgi:hypothetical protein